MTLNHETIGAVTVITPTIESLDIRSGEAFRAEIDAFLTEDAQIVLDLSGVGFVDSSGMGVILSCLKQLNTVGGDLRICCPQDAVRKAFGLVRLDQIIRIFASRDAAVESYA